VLTDVRQAYLRIRPAPEDLRPGTETHLTVTSATQVLMTPPVVSVAASLHARL
jgi:hypothetical protein